MGSLGSRFKAALHLRNWELTPEAATFATSNRWSNKDMDPVPEAYRTWTHISWVTYWISDAFNVASYELASSMLAVGLSWRQALPAIVIGHVIISWAITANGTIGSRLRVPFPVINRSSFGFYFSYFSVVSRLVLAMFWFAVQTYTGSECMYQMLKAIWPSIANVPNKLNGSITTTGMMCYFLFWLLQLPFLFISPQGLRWVFMAKAIIVPPTLLALMIWAFATTGGGAIFKQEGTLSGTALAWAWLGALNSTLGNFSTLAVNIPDFTRYSRSEKDQYIQLFIIPIAFTIVGFIGIAVTSAGFELYGDYYWDPLRLIDQWDNRAAAFFTSFALAIATVCTNISANSLSAANDFTSLLPRWLNIRRGQILCAIIGGWVICPWEILARAMGFLNFMAGYTVFLGPISGIMIADYWFVHHGKIDVPSLYRPQGRYRYIGGVNWRAAVALLVSVPPNLPGLINAINPKIEVHGGIYPYQISWILGFVLASGVYTLTSYFWPAEETMLKEMIWNDHIGSPIAHTSSFPSTGSKDEKGVRQRVVQA